MKNTLNTDKSFLLLSIPLPPEQELEFAKRLMREGCREPILTWNGVIVDGHKRYRICTDEGLDFSTEEKSFLSEEEAVSWICRRRIPLFEKKTPPYRYLVGKLYIAQKQIYHEGKNLPEHERTIRLDPKWDRVSFLVAEELHMHRATVESHGMYANAMDQIAEKSWHLFQAILSGQVRLTFKETQECAGMSEWKLKEFGKSKWGLKETRDNAEKIRIRQKKEAETELVREIPLSVGIKEMPAYDPDMELRGLTLTIPTWIMAISRVEKKTDQATDKAKEQLSHSLLKLREQIDELLGVMEHGREYPDRTAEAVHTGCDL